MGRAHGAGPRTGEEREIDDEKAHDDARDSAAEDGRRDPADCRWCGAMRARLDAANARDEASE